MPDAFDQPERSQDLRTIRSTSIHEWLEANLRRFTGANRLQLGITLIGFALCVIGAKWRMLMIWGSDVPFWDEWGVIGTNILAPWSRGTLDWGSAFFEPHNEHWIPWTQLWALLWTAWNGQWDPLLISTFNAVVHAAVGAFLLWQLWPFLRGVSRFLAPATLTLLLASPVAWENTLYAFQVQFYFVLAAALIHIAFVSVSSVRSWRWWAGLTAGLLGLGTMASSFLAPSAAICVRVLRARQARRWTVDDTLTVSVCALLAGAGYALINPIPAHGSLHANGLTEFVSALARLLAFPFIDLPLMCVVVQSPLIIWLIFRIRRSNMSWTTAEWVFLGVNAWLLLQTMGLAYARANYGAVPTSRYFDIAGLFLVSNAAALGSLGYDPSARPPLTRSALFVAWSVVALVGLVQQAQHQQQGNLARLPELWSARAAHLRDFVTHDRPDSLREAPRWEVPSPSADALIDELQDEALRALLPPSIREPVPFEPDITRAFLNGLSTGLPAPPAAGATWHSTGTSNALWQSNPIPTSELLPVLRITFAGSPGLRNCALRLVTDDGRDACLEIAQFAGTGWQTAHLFVPSRARSVQLVAETSAEGQWLVFSEPVEVGLVSWTAHTARKFNSVLTTVGAALLAFGLFLFYHRPV